MVIFKLFYRKENFVGFNNVWYFFSWICFGNLLRLSIFLKENK